MEHSNAVSMRSKRLFMWLCALALLLSSLPLYAISIYNHPYYDDYGFSAEVHHAWQSTGSLKSVLTQALQSARDTRMNWQGTYTGTLLSNVQPGVFSERLYFIGTIILLTAFIVCFIFFFHTLFKRVFGMETTESVSLSCLLTILMIQLMPDVGEAFYWFNGGIGNVFIYSLLALSAGLSVRLLGARSKARAALITAAMAVLMVLLGGGSYGGGLFGLCLYGIAALWLIVTKNRRKWHFIALLALFLVCFLYSVSAPGNGVRSVHIAKKTSAVSAVAQALYYGMAQIGGFIRLPILAVSLLFLPSMYNAAQKSSYSFKHPWLAALLAYLLFCTQLVPPIYGGVFLGGGRIINTYFISFVVLWTACLYYFAGFAARKAKTSREMTKGQARGLALLCAALLIIGGLGFQRGSDELPGVQNLSGANAALSVVTGEAQTYHREMSEREALLNDAESPSVTLKPLTVSPKVFMSDLLKPDAEYDVRPALCNYYGKESIMIIEEDAEP